VFGVQLKKFPFSFDGPRMCVCVYARACVRMYGSEFTERRRVRKQKSDLHPPSRLSLVSHTRVNKQRRHTLHYAFFSRSILVPSTKTGEEKQEEEARLDEDIEKKRAGRRGKIALVTHANGRENGSVSAAFLSFFYRVLFF
jgi:hypothetical protein